jgi:hypothetical protein
MMRIIFSATLIEDFLKYTKTGKTILSNNGTCFLNDEFLHKNIINSAVAFFVVGLNTFSINLLEML